MSTPYNRSIQAIVLHHMGDGLPPTVPIAQRWNPYNYDYPEYDFGVEYDGTIRQGRPLNIQGSHCLSDKKPYSQKGNQWWNRNSIGIGLAGDFTLYPMPQAQFNALVKLVKKLMNQYGLTLDNVYPHGQVTYTDCPGCVYDKVPALKGFWNYNDFETAVQSNNKIKEDDFQMKNCIVYFSPTDYSSALILSNKFNGCAMFCRNGSPNVHPDALKSAKIFTVGGPKLNVNGEIYLSGNTAQDTLIKVADYLQGK